MPSTPASSGGAVLVLGCLLLLPNAAVWAVAYAAGPGFAVGTGTVVSPFGATLGPVPALPLLAALPAAGSPPAMVRAVLLLPVLAGVAVGVVLARRLPAPAAPAAPASADGEDGAGGSDGSDTPGADGEGWGPVGRAGRAAGWGLAAGLAAAAALTALAALSGGPLGAGYLAAVGPSPWQVALALAVEIAVPAALTAALLPAPDPTAPPADPQPAAE